MKYQELHDVNHLLAVRRNRGNIQDQLSLSHIWIIFVVGLWMLGVCGTVAGVLYSTSKSLNLVEDDSSMSNNIYQEDITIHRKISLDNAMALALGDSRNNLVYQDDINDYNDNFYNNDDFQNGLDTNEVLDMIQDDVEAEENDRPIIGVLSQEIDEDIARKLPAGHNYTSYIAASYVKWAESGGARVVPVIIGQTEEYYLKIFQSINGLLLPGGSAPLTGPGGYSDVGMLFFKWAKQANDEGDYFPIWGTCNGFELLSVISLSDDRSRLTDCYSEDQALPLHLRPNWKQSRIYGQAPRWILRDLTKKPVTINFHHFCLTPTNFTKFGLNKFWNALSVNRDYYDLEYISTIEAKNYPFFGVQFHPEKNKFEWSKKEPKIPHSRAAVKIAGYMADFLVNQARFNNHKFGKGLAHKYLIYNYSPIYTGTPELGSTFEQTYVF